MILNYKKIKRFKSDLCISKTKTKTLSIAALYKTTTLSLCLFEQVNIKNRRLLWKRQKQPHQVHNRSTSLPLHAELSCREAAAYATKSQILKMSLLRGCLVTSQRYPCPDLEFWTLPSLKKIYALVISQYMECPLVQDSLYALLPCKVLQS